MSLEYFVNEEAYLCALRFLLKKKECTPCRIIAFFVLTIGQMSTIVITGLLGLLDKELLHFLLIWSPLMAGTSIAYRSTRSFRAKKILRRLQTSGEFKEDYWQHHFLSIVAGTMHLSYGSVNLECPCKYLTSIEELPDTVLLFSGERIFEIIPVNAFSTCGCDRFLKQLQKEAFSFCDQEIANLNTSFQATTKYKFSYKQNKNCYINRLIRALRIDYLLSLFKQPIEIVKFVLSILLIRYMITKSIGLWYVICIALLAYANRHLLVVLLPSYKKKIVSQFDQFREPDEERNVRVFLYRDTVIAFDERHFQIVPYSEIRRVICSPFSILIYGKQPMHIIYIPRAAIDSFTTQKELARILREKTCPKLSQR